MMLAGGRLFFAFRPLNGKQNKKVSLRTLRLVCLSQEFFLITSREAGEKTFLNSFSH
jgi:hypothetical protein